MKDIAIYGAGGFGREVACLLNIINEKKRQWNLVGFFDDGKIKGEKNEYGEVLGGMADLNVWKNPLSVVIAIGTPHIIKKIAANIQNTNIDFPNIIAPDVLMMDDNNIFFGRGNIVSMKCWLSCNVRIGDFNIFNGLITVGHDAQIGNYNSMMPGVRISGEVTVGDCNYFGVDSVVLQQVKIGNDVVIGSNSVIIRKTKDGNTYIGNPATIVKY